MKRSAGWSAEPHLVFSGAGTMLEWFLALSYAHWLPFSLQTATIPIKAGHPQTRIYYCY